MTQPQGQEIVLAYTRRPRHLHHPQWLQETYGCEIVTFTADLGQGEELAPAREKALAGRKAENIFIDDLRESSCAISSGRCFVANTLYKASICSAPRSRAL